MCYSVMERKAGDKERERERERKERGEREQIWQGEYQHGEESKT